ncbi:MAG: hypothetical protein J6P19_03835 [Acetobacter sp.]|nr:hypothetical protein [Acetobacter sp.]
MKKEKVFIVVKAYPTPSKKHTETVCTAGFREDGSWIRLYPIQFRSLEDEQKYNKYQWIEVELVRSDKDPRPESCRILNVDDIKILGKPIGTGRNHDWGERRKLVLEGKKIYTNTKEIISLAHKNELSLVTFKADKILDLIVKPKALNRFKQGDLFKDLMPEIPYKFSYKFKDDSGKESILSILDWEISQLYLNCRKNSDEQAAIAKVHQKYYTEFVNKKDLYLFLGTTHKWHRRRSKNPFVIIGIFYPPQITQPSLL